MICRFLPGTRRQPPAAAPAPEQANEAPLRGLHGASTSDEARVGRPRDPRPLGATASRPASATVRAKRPKNRYRRVTVATMGPALRAASAGPLPSGDGRVPTRRATMPINIPGSVGIAELHLPRQASPRWPLSTSAAVTPVSRGTGPGRAVSPSPSPEVSDEEGLALLGQFDDIDLPPPATSAATPNPPAGHSAQQQAMPGADAAPKLGPRGAGLLATSGWQARDSYPLTLWSDVAEARYKRSR